jgi:predicted TIM-barrel fold metal-dependent hydrolase
MRPVDCDTHFLEPLGLWGAYIDPEWRDAVPRLVADGSRLLLCVDEAVYPAGRAHTGFGSLYRPDGSVADGVWDLHTVSVDAVQRLARMDSIGTDVEVVYPTVGMAGMHAIRDPRHAAAHARAYNRFAAAVTAGATDRLRAAMIVPLNHPEEAERELVHAREQLGLGVLLASFVAPHPHALSSEDLDRVWAAAVDLDLTVTFQDS